MTCGKALRQVFDKENEEAILSLDQVYQRFQNLFPNKFSQTVVERRLYKYSVNHPSQKNLPGMERRGFLFFLGADQFRKWNPIHDGNWVLQDGEMKQDFAEPDDEQPFDENELPLVASPVSLSIERDLEECLAQNIALLESGMKLYAPNGIIARQFDTKTAGIIDLLATDKQGRFVVIELKAGEAGDKVCGQLLRYMGWVKTNIANTTGVRGIVIASEFSEGIRYAVQAAPNAQLKKYELQFKFSEVPEPEPHASQ